MGKGLADGAVPDNAAGFASQFHLGSLGEAEIRAIAPCTLLDSLMMESHTVGDFQQQCQGHLGNGGRAVAGNVGHRNAQLPRGGHVYHVVARSQHTNVAEAWTDRHEVTGHQGFVGEDDLCARHAGKHILRGGSVINGKVAQGGKGFPGQVSGVQGIAV